MVHHQVDVDPSARADKPAEDGVHEILGDLAYSRLAMVNVVFVGAAGAGDREWILVDAGIPGRAARIRNAAEHRFGPGSRPSAIVLTHGHVDHVGSVKELAEEWDVPIYAHEAEKPFLDGRRAYPPPDPTVGGGIMPVVSLTFPRDPIDISQRLSILPADGSIPGMSGWTWMHTPGHSPGHASFYRPSDGALIVGDAFITTKQESAYAIATQEIEMHGPPTYFTPDWASAKSSVRQLAALNPEVVVTGHGRPLRGDEMRRALNVLARDFDVVAVPKHGRYVLSD